MLKLDRNNTDFSSRLFEFYKGLTWDPEWNFLKDYQNTIRAYASCVDSGNNGILAYLGMGMGKSILAASIIVDAILGGDNGFHSPLLKGKKQRRAKKCIFILTKSLAENMKNAFRKYFELRAKQSGSRTINTDNGPVEANVEFVEAFIRDKIHFVSMNASNMITQFLRAASGVGISGKLSAEDAIPGKILVRDTIVAIDEAHNLSRGITNGSKNGLGFYRTMEVSLRAPGHGNFLLPMTGTPINNNPFELVSIMNMLAGSDVLPTDYEDFKNVFFGSGKSMKNKNIFMDRIMGLVAFVTHESTPLKALKNGNSGTGIEFPDDLGIKVEFCPMSPEQYSRYKLARDLEAEEGTGSGPRGPPTAKKMQLPKSGMTSSYRTKSRQISNFSADEGVTLETLPIKGAYSIKHERMLKNIEKHDGSLGLMYSQYVSLGGLGSFAKYLESKGWTEYKLTYSGPQESDIMADSAVEDENNVVTEDMVSGGNEKIKSKSKDYFHHIINTIRENDSYQSVLYDTVDKPSNMLGASEEQVNAAIYTHDDDDDFDIYGSDDEDHDYVGSAEKNNISRSKKVFAVIKGGLSQESRIDIEKKMQDPLNAHGEIISLVLVSSVGAEGLDFKNIRHVHIEEPYWNYARLAQIQFRAIRNDSHKLLPIDEKNVQTYIYCAVGPEHVCSSGLNVKTCLPDEIDLPDFEAMYDTLPDTTDISLLKEAVKNYRVIESFLGPIQQASITAAIDELPGARLCAPTGERLYTNNILSDIAVPDKCREYTKSTVDVKSIDISGVTFYYRIDDKNPFGVAIYKKSEGLGGFVPMKANEPEFMMILDEVLGSA